MRPDVAADPRQPDRLTVEPSRAWILGLLVEPDGTLTGPALAEPEWLRDATDQTTPPDVPTVRP